MKTPLKRIIILMGLLSLFTGSIGCGRNSGAQGSPENRVVISKMSQDERKAYVREYISAAYDLDCEVSEVKQRQVSAIHNEKDYFCTATLTDGTQVSVWISRDGKLTDAYFMIGMQDRITAFFDEKIKKEFPDCVVTSYTTVTQPPEKTWTAEDSVEQFFSEESASSIIRVFFSEDGKISEKDADRLASLLEEFKGTLFVYLCEDINTIDFETFDKTSYSFTRTLGKENE